MIFTDISNKHIQDLNPHSQISNYQPKKKKSEEPLFFFFLEEIEISFISLELIICN